LKGGGGGRGREIFLLPESNSNKTSIKFVKDVDVLVKPPDGVTPFMRFSRVHFKELPIIKPPYFGTVGGIQFSSVVFSFSTNNTTQHNTTQHKSSYHFRR
jgi:hypothetical protein